MCNFNIPKKLKIIRKKFNFNQSELAGILEIHQSQYSLIENGKQDITLDKIGLLCKKLKVSPVWMMSEGNSIQTEIEIITGMKEEEKTIDTKKDVSFPNDAWEMIKSQQRTIESQQRTIESLSKKESNAKNAHAS